MLDRSTSGTERAVSISVFSRRFRDSSRTEASRSAILTVLSETAAAEGTELVLEKMELEAEVKVGWLEVIAEVTAVERQDMGKSVSSSEGILQIGWWAARMNSSLSFSFSRLAISFCRVDFSSSSLSVSWQRGRIEKVVLRWLFDCH